MKENQTLPILYKKTTTGAIQMWEIYVTNDNTPTINIIWGQLEGKKQETKETIHEGKNIGKSNETTPIEQALFQMKSYWEKQKKKGYVETIEDAKSGKVDKIIKGGISPMLAHVYQKQKSKIIYPALLQPKLDGIRSSSQRKNDIISDSNKITMWSRTRKQINSIPHICKALELTEIESLDGELYNHEYKENFEDLVSIIRQDEPAENHTEIQFHVYDIPHPTLTNFERYKILESLRTIFEYENTPIHIVETIIVNDEDELMNGYKYFMDKGYEGAMVRNMNGLYVNKRSYDLQKIKMFDDDEFKIVNVKIGTKGKMKGLAVFSCITKNGEVFDVKLKGKLEKLREYADNPQSVIGKDLTVQYQGMTKYGKPRFPVGLRIREKI